MDNIFEQMPLVGYFHFSSKDKTQIYYVLQFLHNESDKTRGTERGTIINAFVDEEIYKKIFGSDIGTVYKVEIKPNLNTGKINYRPVV